MTTISPDLDREVIPCPTQSTLVLVWAAAAAAGAGGVFPTGILEADAADRAARMAGEWSPTGGASRLSDWALLSAGEAAAAAEDERTGDRFGCSRPAVGSLAYGSGQSTVSVEGRAVIIAGRTAHSFARRLAAAWEMLDRLDPAGGHRHRAEQARAAVAAHEAAGTVALADVVAEINAAIPAHVAAYADEVEA